MGLPAQKLSSPQQFPKTRVEASLEKWWQAQRSGTTRRGNPFSDARTKGGTVFDIQPQVSSQEAVTVLLELEPVLGYEPSTNVIKRGGYKSRDEFVREVTARVGEDFAKKHG
jgi:hypothetical protein